MKNIYFTSDTHYAHKNICRGVTGWEENVGEQRTRDFRTLDDMNDAIVNSINGMVKDNDVLYHLGDWSFGGHEKIKEFRDRLNCKEIHLIFGNHDQHIEPINSVYRNLFTSVQYVLQLSMKIDSAKTGRYGKQGFFLSHYSHQVWNKSHHGVIHLFGHSHGTLNGIGKSMDVGVDTNDMHPYHLDEILDIMKGKEMRVVDHHNSKTT